MIHVRRITEHDSPVFEVVVREGKDETRHHVTMSRESCLLNPLKLVLNLFLKLQKHSFYLRDLIL
jgi:hypothetical protein